MEFNRTIEQNYQLQINYARNVQYQEQVPQPQLQEQMHQPHLQEQMPQLHHQEQIPHENGNCNSVLEEKPLLDTVVENVETEGIVAQTSKNINVTKLKYKDAQTIIQKQNKYQIQSEAYLRTSLGIRKKENEYILSKINEEEKLMEMLQLEYEKVRIQASQAKNSLINMYQTSNASEIIDELRENINILKDKSKSIDESYEIMFTEVAEQKEQIKTLTDRSQHLENLKKKLNDLKQLQKIRLSEKDKAKKTNLLLKQKMIEKREYLGKLKSQFEDLQKVHSASNEEKINLQKELAEKKDKIFELNRDIDDLTTEKNEEIKEMSETFENKIQRINILEEKVKANDADLTESKNVLEELQQKLDMNLQKQLESEVKCIELGRKKAEIEKKTSEMIEQRSSEISKMKTALETLGKKLCDLNKENFNKPMEMRLILKQYFEKIKERDDTVLKRNTLEAKIISENEEIRKLDEQIASREVAITDAEKRLGNIPHNPKLIELSEKKAFANACKEFLSEKFKTIEEELTEARSTLKKAKDRVNFLEKALDSKTAEINAKKYKSRNTTTMQAQTLSLQGKSNIIEQDNNESTFSTPSRSILKTTSNPGTPKKSVQFENLSSLESTDQEMDLAQDNTFPDYQKLMAEFKKMRNQPVPSRPSKKRRFVYD